MDSTHVTHEADLHLARAAAAGDPAAKQRFAERMECLPRLVRAVERRMAVRLTPDESLDLTQEVLVRVWSKLDAYEGRATLESWVLRFVFLELRNFLRKRDRSRIPQSEGLEELQAEIPETISPEAHAFLMQSLEELSPPAPEILRLRHHEQLTFDQIGARLGIPGNTAKTLYHRGLAKLRTRLEPRLRGEFR